MQLLNRKKIDEVKSFLVSKDGKLVTENYYNGNNLDELNRVRSVTKSILSTLVGIAIDKKYIKSVDDPIGKYLTKHKLTEQQKAIKIRHLLTMTGGMDWIGEDKDYNLWIKSGDHIGVILRKKIVAPFRNKVCL